MKHFETHYSRSSSGRFVILLPRKENSPVIGESRSQAVRFLHLEKSLSVIGLSKQFNNVINEYFDEGHAEPIPVADLKKTPTEVFYVPMHIVQKESNTTTKVRAVFDASAKSMTGISLNDTLLVGPTVHSCLVDLLLRFCLHRIALTIDVNWRCNPNQPL